MKYLYFCKGQGRSQSLVNSSYFVGVHCKSQALSQSMYV